jgi:hypothetical protein
MTGPYIFTDAAILHRFALQRSMRGFYTGADTPQNRALIQSCSHILRFSPGLEATVLFTRDTGHHTGGWWKNPDYERCWHLSLAYRHPMLPGAMLPHDHARSAAIAREFFGDDAAKAWIEKPYSPQGKRSDVWHYRVFCDEGWRPHMPRGEVYSREWTPKGWQSFSEVHGVSLDDVDAPFLKDASL